MTINQISNRLITLLENKAFIEAQKELFDDNVVSIEPSFHPKPITKGLEKLLIKEQQFIDSIASWEDFQPH
ncbi:MAG: SnoaL-like domain-containing protein [Cytophagales bacterium]|nr:SnoaL-like domain-containing protein [Cytophagales bacterium]